MKLIILYPVSLGIMYVAMSLSGMSLISFYDQNAIFMMLMAVGLAWLNWGKIEPGHMAAWPLLRKRQMLNVFWRYQTMVVTFSWVINLIIVLADQGENMVTIGQGLALLLISSIYLLLLRLLVIQPKIVAAEKALIMLRK